jgi:hypothetical protein
MNNTIFSLETPLTNKKVGVAFDTGEALEAGEKFSWCYFNPSSTTGDKLG